MATTTTTARRGRKAYDGPKPEEILVSDLVELMESAGLPPWRREWAGHQGEHRNMLSGHCYRGSNPILLELGSMLRGHTMPLWLGAAEAKAKGWWPRKGCKAVRIVRPQLNQREQTDAAGQPVTGPDGSPLVAAWVSFKPVAVFNAADLVGHDDETARTLAAAIAEALGNTDQREPAARLETAETVLEAWPVPTTWGGVKAIYSPDLDEIRMPAHEAFASREAMCATWAHEQAHSTGHDSRLARAIRNRPDSQGYAREELVAELAAVLICYRLEIGCELQNHAAYLSHWAQLLRDGGPRVLFQVLGDARKAADLIAPEAPAEEA
jgi:antirestriction protein ArdC